MTTLGTKTDWSLFQIDTNAFTLQELIKDVVKAKLGFVEPSLDIGSSIIYEEGEDACDSHLKYYHKKLCDCPAGGIRNGTILTIEDFRQDLKVATFCSLFSIFQALMTALFVGCCSHKACRFSGFRRRKVSRPFFD